MFRGSDVKDLRIEETPKENKPPQPPKVPDDPAILGVSFSSLHTLVSVCDSTDSDDEVFRM